MCRSETTRILMITSPSWKLFILSKKKGNDDPWLKVWLIKQHRVWMMCIKPNIGFSVSTHGWCKKKKNKALSVYEFLLYEYLLSSLAPHYQQVRESAAILCRASLTTNASGFIILLLQIYLVNACCTQLYNVLGSLIPFLFNLIHHFALN